MNETEILKVITDACLDKKGTDVKVLDLRGLCCFTDYFILVTGNNKSQVQAIADNVNEAMAKAGISLKSTEGYDNASWILQDYSDYVVHVFLPETREFYNLERIWRDAKVMNIED